MDVKAKKGWYMRYSQLLQEQAKQFLAKVRSKEMRIHFNRMSETYHDQTYRGRRNFLLAQKNT